MNTIAQLFVILSILIFNGYLIHILRKELIEYQYALLWLTAGLGMLFFAIYPKALWDLSDFLGIGIPLNLVYFSAIILCLVLIFQTNISLSKIRQCNNDLIQEVSMLKSQVDQLQKQLTVPSILSPVRDEEHPIAAEIVSPISTETVPQP